MKNSELKFLSFYVLAAVVYAVDPVAEEVYPPLFVVQCVTLMVVGCFGWSYYLKKVWQEFDSHIGYCYLMGAVSVMFLVLITFLMDATLFGNDILSTSWCIHRVMYMGLGVIWFRLWASL